MSWDRSARRTPTAGSWRNVGKMLEYVPYCEYGLDEYGTSCLVQADSQMTWVLMRAAGC